MAIPVPTVQARGPMANPFQIAGTTDPPKPPVPLALVVLSFLPLLLVPIGGLLGGLIGGAAAAINLVVARGRLAVPAKVVVDAGPDRRRDRALRRCRHRGTDRRRPARSPTLQVGTCLNGIHPGAAVTADVHADRSTARRPTTTRSSASCRTRSQGRIPARPPSTGSRTHRASRLSAATWASTSRSRPST